MAFSWAGDLSGCLPVKKYFQIGETCYQGQMLQYDENTTTGGYVIPVKAAGEAPDTSSLIMGICSGIVTSPVYTAGYKGDCGTYDTTLAAVLANDPVGPTMAEVILVTPTTLIRGSVVKDTVGTNPARITNTTASSDGTTVTSTAIDTTVDSLSTMYCVSGANAGKFRKVTAASTTSQVAVVPFPYAIAVGDIFTIANIVEGKAWLAWDTLFQGLDSSAPFTSSYRFDAYVHELNLAEAGREYAVFCLHGKHLVIG
jgi:hypothetical protein